MRGADDAPGGPTAPRADQPWDDRSRARDTVGAHPGAAGAWLGLMTLLVAGFALMGAAFAQDSAWLFVGGLTLSGVAFVLPLAVHPRRDSHP